PYGFGEDEGVEGAGAAPFRGYEDKPVLLKAGSEYIVLDGHNRISAAIRSGQGVPTSYVFEAVDVSQNWRQELFGTSKAFNPDEPRDERGRWTEGGQWQRS